MDLFNLPKISRHITSESILHRELYMDLHDIIPKISPYV